MNQLFFTPTLHLNQKEKVKVFTSLNFFIRYTLLAYSLISFVDELVVWKVKYMLWEDVNLVDIVSSLCDYLIFWVNVKGIQ